MNFREFFVKYMMPQVDWKRVLRYLLYLFLIYDNTVCRTQYRLQILMLKVRMRIGYRFITSFTVLKSAQLTINSP